MGDVLNGLFGTKNKYQATAPNVGMQYLQTGIDQAGNNYSQAQGHQQNILNSQQALAQELQKQSQGQGTNLGQLQLQNALNQNVQTGASQIASQHGINPALAARLISQNTSNANQQAAGQSANLQAQSQMQSQQALAQQQQAMGNVAGQMGQQGIQQQGVLQQAQAAQNNAINQAQLGAQGINAGVAQQNAQQSGGIVGGLLGGVGSFLGLAHGGEVPAYASGGAVANPFDLTHPQGIMTGLGAGIGGQNNPWANAFTGFGKAAHDATFSPSVNPQGLGASFNAPGTTPSLGSNLGLGPMPQSVDQLATGGYIQGKAETPGDSLKNDTVPVLASPGEIFINRENAQSPEKAHAFLDEILKNKKKSTAGGSGYGKVLDAKRKLDQSKGAK